MHIRFVLLITLALPYASFAQVDVFNAGGGEGTCEERKENETRLSKARLDAIHGEQEIGGTDEERILKVRLAEIDEEARHNKVNRQIEADCNTPLAFGRTTCLREQNAEARKHAQALAKLDIQEFEAGRIFKRAMASCPPGAQCSDAHAEYQAALASTRRQRTAENQRHEAAVGALRRSVCSGTDQFGGTSDNPGGSTERPRPVRSPRPSPTVYPGEEPGFCCGQPFDVRNPVAGADPKLNFTLGFERGFAECLEQGATSPASLCMVVTAMMAAKFRNAALMAGVVGTGRVLALAALMQEMQKDLETSDDPFATAIDYGRRACVWFGAALAVKPGPNSGRAQPKKTVDSKGAGCSNDPDPLVPKNAPLDPTNANDWLPQINPDGCRTNCGLVAAAVDNAQGKASCRLLR